VTRPCMTKNISIYDESTSLDLDQNRCNNAFCYKPYTNLFWLVINWTISQVDRTKAIAKKSIWGFNEKYWKSIYKLL